MADPAQPNTGLGPAVQHADANAGSGPVGGVCAPCAAAAAQAAAARSAAAPPAAAQPKPTVNPVIKTAKFVVLVRKYHTVGGVRKPYTTPKRFALVLTTDAAFNGKGTFTRSNDNIKFYKSSSRDDEIKFDGKDNVFSGGALTAGVTVYASGSKPSGAMDDVKLTLKLTGGSKNNGPDATSTATSVELTLDICKGRPSPGVEPPAIVPDEKVAHGRSVLEQVDARYQRAMLIIRPVKPATFVGHVILKADNAHTTLFHLEKRAPGETALNGYAVVAALIPAAGDKLWAEGAAVSASMRDAGFSIGVAGWDDEGDRVKMTVVKLTLDICKSRSKADVAGADLPALSPAEKITPGRFLHEQDVAKRHGRAMLIVRKVKPATFDGKIRLEPLNPVKTAIFAAERPPVGAELAIPAPIDIDYKSARNEDKKFWVEGKKASGVLYDAGYALHLFEDPIANSDVVTVTVALFTKITATIKSTPPNSPANSTAAGIALPADHIFNATVSDDSFTTNLPLVLIRNAQPDIKLLLTAQPANLPIAWDSVRNSLDHASIGTAAQKPTLTPIAANKLQCTLSANAKGSFRVRPFINQNAVASYDDFEPSMPLNLVLVDATVNGADRSTPTTIVTPETIFLNGFQCQTGAWTTAPFSISANEAMQMNLEVDLVGGGADGKLGLDMVFGGLQNQTIAHIHEGTYIDVTAVPPKVMKFRFRYASNKSAASAAYGTPPNSTAMFKTGDAAPAAFVFPLLDSGRSPINGDGGNTVTMNSSQTQLTAVQPAIGQRMEIWCMDSPRRTFPSPHPLNANANLIFVRYRHEFRADFLLWTNVSKSPGRTLSVAERVYSVIRKVPWTLDGNWTTDFTTTPAAPTFTRGAYAVTSAGAATVNPVGRAQDHTVEVRPPSGITGGIVIDAQ